ncbi:protein of unknown function [Tenacibaculum sp. 190524A02b]|uniref:hypothetical protein n=1 Tax=Tenacibaculum vairaonense TaxID=3137860 RepID=UPI0032B2AAD9
MTQNTYKTKAIKAFENLNELSLKKLKEKLENHLSNGEFEFKTVNLPEPFNKADVVNGIESRYLIYLGMIPVPNKFSHGDYDSYTFF